ncbi:glycoside hydrolase family 55 protein [Cohnella silvisoli]|uniref:Glycoside hydrolase family 55 protein n=1 Tax=Cohnella silvisoli TaxID=2873699 RepID=A0ABV1KUT4_9BACL|nr:glycoside hydrolase family 55 protein [Cohnella silvisoli]MCD9022696.1 glycoside hydrolase family 55 protein [Cohnella silvisoli]
MAGLKAFGVPTQNIVVSLAGYYAVNDGGGGLFYWDSGATEADNNGTVIIPASNPGSGRWRRTLTDKDYNVKWFGAKGDGTNDDTAAIQSAINSLPARGGTVYFPGGVYSITSTITVGNGDGGTNFSTKNGVKLIGEGGAFGVDDPNMRPTVLMCNATMPAAIDVRGRISDVHIENIHIRCILNATVGIKLTAVSGTQMRNVKILHYTEVGLFIIGGNAPVGNYNIFNEFDNVNVASTHNNSICLYMDGNYAVQNDTWITSWRNCRFDTVNSQNSVCAWFKFVDSNSFYRCHFACYDSSSNGIIFDAQANNDFPSGMAFYDCSIYNTVVYEDATHKIRKNYFYGNGTYDNEVIPTHPKLIGFTDDGRNFNMALQPLSTMTANEIGNVQWINKGLAESVTLPAGGEWEYDILLVNISTGMFNRVGGIAAGGSVVNNTANVFKFARVKRLKA